MSSLPNVHHYWIARAVVGVLALTILPGTARAQRTVSDNCDAAALTDTQASAMARQHAPVLRFAPGERMFPTLPFYAAFAGRGADDTLLGKPPGSLDDIAPLITVKGVEAANLAAIRSTYLGDSGFVLAERLRTQLNTLEFYAGKGTLRAIFRFLDRMHGVAEAKMPDSTRMARITELSSRLDTLLDSLDGTAKVLREDRLNNALDHSVVFYTVCPLDTKTSERWWQILLSDPQLTSRLVYRNGSINSFMYARMAAITYYMYYLDDEGLQGHPNDVEKFVVFVPLTRPSLFRVEVGNNHTMLTPNNILLHDLLGRRQDDDSATGCGTLAGGKTPPPCSQVLVELGGHSVSPDLGPLGQFSVGRDINWGITDRVWGVRDVQAVAGLGYAGNYQSWMTIARDKNAVTLSPPAPRTPGTSSDSARRTDSYTLLPLEPFRQLSLLLDSLFTPPGGAITTPLDSSARVNVTSRAWGTLHDVETLFAGWRPPVRGLLMDQPPSLAVLQRFWLWNRPARAGTKWKDPGSALPWLRGEYSESPIRFFKPWLYPPAMRLCVKFGAVLPAFLLYAGAGAVGAGIARNDPDIGNRILVGIPAGAVAFIGVLGIGTMSGSATQSGFEVGVESGTDEFGVRPRIGFTPPPACVFGRTASVPGVLQAKMLFDHGPILRLEYRDVFYDPHGLAVTVSLDEADDAWEDGSVKSSFGLRPGLAFHPLSFLATLFHLDDSAGLLVHRVQVEIGYMFAEKRSPVGRGLQIGVSTRF